MPIKMTVDGVEYDLKTYGAAHITVSAKSFDKNKR